MVTRFTATEARQNTELAKQKIANEKKSLKAAEIEKTKELAAIEAGWKLQSEELLKAAIDGKTSLKFEERIFNLQKLISLGFRVYEEGAIETELLTKNLDPHARNINVAKKRIFKCFDLFIDASKSEVAHNFLDIEDYHATVYSLLLEHMNGDYDDFSNEDDDTLLLILSGMDELAGCDLDHFNHELLQVEKAVKVYKALMQSIDDDGPDVTKTLGQHEFTDEDVDVSVRTPTEDGNFLVVDWSENHDDFFLNDPLFSVDGLSWLSGKYGQQLMSSIFDFLRIETDKGKRSAVLKFEMFNAQGWFFIDARGMDVYSCVPDEIPSLVQSDGFSLVDTTSTKSKYSITLSW